MYQPYLITVDPVLNPRDRTEFQKLTRKHTWRAVTPQREPGGRGLWVVEMNQSEYERALEAAQDPNSNLVRVTLDRPLHTPRDDVPGTAELAYLEMREDEYTELDGTGVTVGIIDTPIAEDLYNYFQGRINYWTPPGKQRYTLTESHGTKMASLAVPPGATLAHAGVSGFGLSYMIEAYYWMLEVIHPDVLNMSYGFYVEQPEETEAIAALYNAGILLINAAGNDSQSFLGYPSEYEGVYAISNYDSTTDAPEHDTNFGPKIWAAATGHPVTWYQEDGLVPVTSTLGGTSASSALTTRAVTRLLTGHRVSPYNAIQALGMTTRTPASGTSDYYGSGVIQFRAAVDFLQLATPLPMNFDGCYEINDPGGYYTYDDGTGGSIDGGSTICPTNELTPGQTESATCSPDHCGSAGIWGHNQSPESSLCGASTGPAGASMTQRDGTTSKLGPCASICGPTESIDQSTMETGACSSNEECEIPEDDSPLPDPPGPTPGQTDPCTHVYEDDITTACTQALIACTAYQRFHDSAGRPYWGIMTEAGNGSKNDKCPLFSPCSQEDDDTGCFHSNCINSLVSECGWTGEEQDCCPTTPAPCTTEPCYNPGFVLESPCPPSSWFGECPDGHTPYHP